MWLDHFTFDGRVALVTGGASGMGAAAAATLQELGAEVHVLDIRAGAQADVAYHDVDLRTEASIDAVLQVLPAQVDVLVNCAGMPQTFPYADVLACNFAGTRHLTEAVLERMPAGGAVTSVSSIVGRPWKRFVEVLGGLVASPDMAAAMRWIDEHPELGDPYVLSKMALNIYTTVRAPEVAARGIRMNAILPGNTQTAMTQEFEAFAGAEVLGAMSAVAGRPADPQQQADVLVFLSSGAASYVNGALVDVDGGYTAGLTASKLAAQVPTDATA